ncbi:MAG: hypothetical protein H0T68_00385 [Gemmatimonadales bacterium]|nr:hypothetical protein [Gemmatimonadales bacterium]
MADTFVCPNCGKTYPWNTEMYNWAAEMCTVCSPVITGEQVAIAASQARLPGRVILTGLKLPMADLLVLTFKMSIAGVIVGILFYGVFLLLQAVLDGG